MSRGKDTKTVWLEEGLKILATKGPACLSIESLTSAAKKTKGSFYHHFDSRDHYIEQLLEYYGKITTDEIIGDVNQGGDPRAQLKRLTELTFQLSGDLELIIRAWSLYDPKVKAFRDRLDRQRLEHVKGLHMSLGIKPDKARILACRDYSVYLGLQQLKEHIGNAELRRVLRGIYSDDA